MTAPAAAAGATRRDTVFRVHNQVLLVLLLAGIVAILAGGFVTVAPNRLLSGRPAPLWRAASPALLVPIAGFGAVLAASTVLRSRRVLHWLAAAASAGLCLMVLAAAGGAAPAPSGPGALSRVSLGPAFWVLLMVGGLAVIDSLQRARAGMAPRLIVAAVLAGGFALMAWAGVFNGLSLAREYHARQDVFAGALTRHVVLVLASVGTAVVIGAPLGIAAARRPAMQPTLFAVLNLLQTIPSIALFGLLIAPLSAVATAVPGLAAIGVGGVGVAPALIALVLYALLPVVRSTAAAVAGVDAAVLDAARGMGMSRRRMLWQVELPLAAPVLLAGLRIVTVQAIGLTVVAALIGAGGLGAFVFEGLGQNAADLILLGALPAILLALGADLLLQALAAAAARQVRP